MKLSILYYPETAQQWSLYYSKSITRFVCSDIWSMIAQVLFPGCCLGTDASTVRPCYQGFPNHKNPQCDPYQTPPGHAVLFNYSLLSVLEKPSVTDLTDCQMLWQLPDNTVSLFMMSSFMLSGACFKCVIFCQIKQFTHTWLVCMWAKLHTNLTSPFESLKAFSVANENSLHNWPYQPASVEWAAGELRNV